MSDIIQLSARAANQSVSEVITPGIVSIFIQGFETGLVLSQLSQWLALERTEGIAMTLLVIYVTTIGFLETAVCFASAYRIYVRGFGQTIIPEWTESVHVILSALVAAPIQAYFISRCYHILKRNFCLIIPLIITLITNVVTAAWATAWLFRVHAARRANIAAVASGAAPYRPSPTTIFYPFVLSITLPAALDITITSILLFSLTNFLRRIHAGHIRRRITRYMIVIWQAVIPPCFCAIGLVIKYITFTQTQPGGRQAWYPAIQAMLGKLYVLSLFFTLNNRMDLTEAHEPPITYVSTFNTSLNGVGSPRQRYVFSVQLTDQEQQC